MEQAQARLDELQNPDKYQKKVDKPAEKKESIEKRSVKKSSVLRVDSKRIDNLLNQTHGLWNASVKHPHRGDVCYLHRSLWENNPDITMWEISGS